MCLTYEIEREDATNEMKYMINTRQKKISPRTVVFTINTQKPIKTNKAVFYKTAILVREQSLVLKLRRPDIISGGNISPQNMACMTENAK